MNLALSKDCADLNPHIGRSRTRVGLRCGMNKTESEFALRLEAQKRAGEILRYEFEGMTLRFANVRYTPDFVVFESWLSSIHKAARLEPSVANIQLDERMIIKFIEVKGPFIKGNRERAVERFRHAKTYWPEFTFEMWQKKDGAWTQII